MLLFGLTPTITTQQFIRINLSLVVVSGTQNTNVGNIIISQVITTNHLCYISTGEGIHHCSKFSISNSETAIPRQMEIRAGRVSGANQQPILNLRLINFQRVLGTDLVILEFFHDCSNNNYALVELFTLNNSPSGDVELHCTTDRIDTFLECVFTGTRVSL